MSPTSTWKRISRAAGEPTAMAFAPDSVTYELEVTGVIDDALD